MMAIERSEAGNSHSDSVDLVDQQMQDLSREELEKWYMFVAHMFTFVILDQGGVVRVRRDQLEEFPRNMKLYYYQDMQTQDWIIEAKEVHI